MILLSNVYICFIFFCNNVLYIDCNQRTFCVLTVQLINPLYCGCSLYFTNFHIICHTTCYIFGQKIEMLLFLSITLITRSSAIAVIADRTACTILTLFIVSTTSRPLNKKSVCCQSANPINNYCGSASANSQSAHLCAPAVGTAAQASVAPDGTVPTRSARNAITVFSDAGF